jgi:hypothetical protein
MAKKPVCDMGKYIPDDHELDAYSWCINNKILISPKPKNTSSWYIEINANGKSSISPIAYPKSEIWKKLYEYYKYYYDKYREGI